MKRREFIILLGGAATAWPIAARAQQADRMRRIGVLMVVAETDPDAKRFIEALETRLDAAGWYRGRNLGISYRWGADDSELLALRPNDLGLPPADVVVGRVGFERAFFLLTAGQRASDVIAAGALEGGR